METIKGFVSRAYEVSSDQFWSLVNTPFDPSQRLFWLYLCSGVFFAFGVFYYKNRAGGSNPKSLLSFLAFLFPKSVWSHPSAWLDLRFFVINQFTGKLLYAGLAAVSMGFVFYWVTGGDSLVDVLKESQLPTVGDFVMSMIYMMVVVAVTDFVAFYIHYLQHKIPVLWEFHKVHHSPEVMHPLSNFREHPFDNVAYALGIGLSYGLLLGGISVFLGYLPNMPTVLGVPYWRSYSILAVTICAILISGCVGQDVGR